jgi:hypothetical protein
MPLNGPEADIKRVVRSPDGSLLCYDANGDFLMEITEEGLEILLLELTDVLVVEGGLAAKDDQIVFETDEGPMTLGEDGSVQKFKPGVDVEGMKAVAESLREDGGGDLADKILAWLGE